MKNTKTSERRIMDGIQREEKMKSGERDWSEMCSDAMQLIFERLNFPVFHRARFVCSRWYSVSKSCVGGFPNRYPWLIIFPEKYSDSESCKLFDPIEDKTYQTKDLGVEISESSCLASYGNWLLMLNQNLDFSILNVFSGERIDLPPLTLRGKVRFRRTDDGDFLLVHSRKDCDRIFGMNIEKGMLWINEETKDFVVSWIYSDRYLFSYKKGDDSWWYFEGTTCLSMAYKDQKLYVYTRNDYIKILDFSGDDFPKELVEENPYLKLWFGNVRKPWRDVWEKRIAITSSGDVVIVVLSLKEPPENQDKVSFYVFKMNRKGTKWERVDSLGDEMLVFGDGLTLAASAIEGGGICKSNLIYFVVDDVWPSHARDAIFPSSACVFDLKTAKLTWSRFPYCSSKHRWFVPGSDKK